MPVFNKKAPPTILTPEWRRRLSTLSDRHQRCALKRFAVFCCSRGLEPDEIGDDDLQAFGIAAADGCVPRPFQAMRDAGRAWNSAATAAQGWPQTRLTVPCSERHQRRSPGVSAYPESFGRDVEAFLTRKPAESLFDDKPLGASRPATIRDRRGKILQLASRAVDCGRDPASITALADLVSEETARLVLSSLWAEAGEQPNGHHANLARLMVIIAKHWVHLPEDQILTLKHVEKRFRPARTGMVTKNRERLRQFVDEANLRRLITLPDKVLATLDLGNPRVSDAVRVQKALAVALLLAAPVRVKNLASIDIEQHLQRVSETDCFLIFPQMEVKNRRDLEYPLPISVIRLLDLYLGVYRPLLAKKAGSKLFISLNGNEKDPGYLSAQIPDFINRESGLRMNLHLFRHLAGFIYLRRHPGEYETVRQLLGHQTIETTVAFYTGLEHEQSFRRYDDILDRYRCERTHVDA